MQALKQIIITLFLGFSLIGFTQNREFHISQQGIYSDRITDELGKPLEGIKIQVQNTGEITYSDYDGNFKIKAKIGDVIVLSKDGKRINSYKLDGRNDYRVEDLSSDKTLVKNSYKKKIANTNYLDSATYYIQKDPYKSIDFIALQLKSKRGKNNEEVANIYTLLGDAYKQLHQYDLAVDNYTKALEYHKEEIVQIKLAKALYHTGDYKKSKNLFNNIKTKRLSHWYQVEIQEGIGDNAIVLGNSDEALQHYKKGLKFKLK